MLTVVVVVAAFLGGRMPMQRKIEQLEDTVEQARHREAIARRNAERTTMVTERRIREARATIEKLESELNEKRMSGRTTAETKTRLHAESATQTEVANASQPDAKAP